MWRQTAQIAAIILIFTAASPSPSPQRRATKKPAPKATAEKVPALPSGDYMSHLILLDRKGFSPGPIDGKPGKNFNNALLALGEARKLALKGPDCDAWRALGADGAGALVQPYTVTDADVKGPFT